MLITFEGGEGSGKTTLIKRLELYLREQRRDVIQTREPGGSPLAEDIRKVILNKKNTGLTATAEALLYAASRNQHINDTIRPNVKEGRIVICDRYLDSSLVYQGVARNLGLSYIKKINNFMRKKDMPAITFLLDIEPRLGLERVSTRAEINRLDLETEQFHEMVRTAYLLLATKNKKRFIVLDASKSEEELFIEMIDKLKNHKQYKKYEKRHPIL